MVLLQEKALLSVTTMLISAYRRWLYIWSRASNYCIGQWFLHLLALGVTLKKFHFTCRSSLCGYNGDLAAVLPPSTRLFKFWSHIQPYLLWQFHNPYKVKIQKLGGCWTHNLRTTGLGGLAGFHGSRVALQISCLGTSPWLCSTEVWLYTALFRFAPANLFQSASTDHVIIASLAKELVSRDKNGPICIRGLSFSYILVVLTMFFWSDPHQDHFL